MGTFPKDALASLPVTSGFLEHRGLLIFKKFQEVNVSNSCSVLATCTNSLQLRKLLSPRKLIIREYSAGKQLLVGRETEAQI